MVLTSRLRASPILDFISLSQTTDSQPLHISITLMNPQAVSKTSSKGCVACGICGGSHSVKQPCVIPCHICGDLHPTEDYGDAICPKLMPFVKEVRHVPDYECNQCEYFSETDGQLGQKLDEGDESKQTDEMDTNSTIPHNGEDFFCESCMNTGTVKKYYPCCRRGCKHCGYRGIVLNVNWKDYRERDKGVLEVSQAEQECSICFEKIAVESEMYKMDCRHRFHLECIMEWFKSKRNCPVCRRQDWFMPASMQEKYELQLTCYEFQLSDCPSESQSSNSEQPAELPNHFRQFRPN